MRILVIEDERVIANNIARGLKLERFAVDLAYDGVSGYDLAASEDYEVIILDRMLPGMDGLTICKKLRAVGVNAPVLMLTAKGQIDERVEGLNSGADDYLPKPFAFAELLARVRALTRRPRAALNEVLTVDDLSLNARTFVVTRGESDIKLSRKEFALLEFLMRHSGQILTKENIINHVWEYDADILPNTVEVYIGYLRSHIDKAFPKRRPLIHTVRGFGYKIGKG